MAAYTSLAVSEIRLPGPERLVNAFSSRFPALNIAQMRVDRRFTGHRIGEELVAFGLNRGTPPMIPACRRRSQSSASSSSDVNMDPRRVGSEARLLIPNDAPIAAAALHHSGAASLNKLARQVDADANGTQDSARVKTMTSAIRRLAAASSKRAPHAAGKTKAPGSGRLSFFTLRFFWGAFRSRQADDHGCAGRCRSLTANP